MPQTKFVLSRRQLGLKPIVVINKIDRQDARHEEDEEIFDLFIGARCGDHREQLDFPVLYARPRAVNDLNDERASLTPLFEKIVSIVPHAEGRRAEGTEDHPFTMLVTTIQPDPISAASSPAASSGVATPNRNIQGAERDGNVAGAAASPRSSPSAA